jgi:hypothetical protein
LETSPSVVHRGRKYFELIDIHVDSYSSSKIPPKPLIDLHNFPLGFCQEAISSLKPFLKNPVNPPSFEAHNCILQNIMANLGGGRDGGNQPPPPPLNPWVTTIFGPLNLPVNVHDLPENYLKLFPKYNGEPTLSVEEHLVTFQDFTDNLFVEHDDVFMRLFVQTLEGDV